VEEVPIIRCLGLNYRDHALEADMPIPDVPVLFVIPKLHKTDYEAELSLIISKTGKDIMEEDAMDYVLGYTSSNDVSARAQQWKTSQWSFSKGMLYFYSVSLL
jgi:2-keto-4-pentenoate hydratase/2-oxohepta-3-ene-1,7-dioic acid hydratase in catechol pathway